MSPVSNSSTERRAAFWILAAAALLLFLPVAKTLFFAVTTAAVAHPLKERLRRLFRRPERTRAHLFATLGAMAAVFLLGGALVAATVVVVVLDFETLREFVTSVAGEMDRFARSLSPRAPDLSAEAMRLVQVAADYAYGVARATGALLLHVLVFTLALYGFLRHGPKALAAVRDAAGERIWKTLSPLLRRAHDVLYAVYFVHLVTALATFVLALGFFRAVGFSNVLFWALICALLQLVPFLGPTLVMAAVAAWCFYKGRTTEGVLILAVGYPVVCAAPDFLLRPVLMGRHARVNAALLWIGFFAGVASAGVFGFVAGPVLTTLTAEAARTPSPKKKESSPPASNGAASASPTRNSD